VQADGDARRALNAIESAAALEGRGGTNSAENAREALQLRIARYYKGGNEHYNMLSAYHKSLRGCYPHAALYLLALLIDGGGDPIILFGRAFALAAEYIGLADPEALKLAVAARDAYHMLGPPEGYLPLAEMTIYLATAPKSNSGMVALGRAMEAARETPAAPVPLHIRNAPTRLMGDLGYGRGYRYAHDEADAYAAQEYLPEALVGSRFYEPHDLGYEKRIGERLAYWEERRRSAEDSGGTPGKVDDPAP
jgi:putative ATPase